MQFTSLQETSNYSSSLHNNSARLQQTAELGTVSLAAERYESLCGHPVVQEHNTGHAEFGFHWIITTYEHIKLSSELCTSQFSKNMKLLIIFGAKQFYLTISHAQEVSSCTRACGEIPVVQEVNSTGYGQFWFRHYELNGLRLEFIHFTALHEHQPTHHLRCKPRLAFGGAPKLQSIYVVEWRAGLSTLMAVW